MRVSYWPEAVARNGGEVYAAALASICDAGDTLVKEDWNADAALIWSVLWHGRMAPNQSVWRAYRDSGRPTTVLEVGGLVRGKTWRWGLNGITRGCLPVGVIDTARADALGVALRPWRAEGDAVMICAQHHHSESWSGQPPASEWMASVIDEIRAVSRRPIIIRPHPRCPLNGIEGMWKDVTRQDPRPVAGTYDDFDLRFDGLHALVNWNSNPGPQAVVAGVPVWTGPDSIAATVGNTLISTIESPKLPERSAWFDEYVHMEWLLEEIASGAPWSLLKRQMETSSMPAVRSLTM